jgi:hypothetical protein
LLLEVFPEKDADIQSAEKAKLHVGRFWKSWGKEPLEARAGIEPTYEDLQSSAWPLCHRANMPLTADDLALRRIEPSFARVKHATESKFAWIFTQLSPESR